MFLILREFITAWFLTLEILENRLNFDNILVCGDLFFLSIIQIKEFLFIVFTAEFYGLYNDIVLTLI